LPGFAVVEFRQQLFGKFASETLLVSAGKSDFEKKKEFCGN